MNNKEKAKKILVIEDNESNLYLITYILRHNGYTVLEARTGEEGVKIASEKKPDLIILDIQLPGIDGIKTARRIRALKTEGDIPIIALTSFVMDKDHERVLAAGCNGYIEKPINPETIMTEIEHFL